MPKRGVRVPLVVRLARGDVSERTARELTSILQALHHGATLTPRVGEVVTRLLMTAGQAILRFSQYAEYPDRAALLSRTYNLKDTKRCYVLACIPKGTGFRTL